MLLDFQWNRVKIIFLFEEYCDSVVLPKMLEVALYFFAQLNWDVFTDGVRLRTDLLD